MNKIVKIVVTMCVVGLSSVFAQAKPMPERLGVGLKNNTAESVPSLALLYNVNSEFAFFGGAGFDTQKDNSKLQINAGVRHIIFHENQLHFYTAGQLGMVNYEFAGQKENGMEVLLLAGAEFFFTGLENVGFSFEAGFGLSTVDSTRVFTVANHPLKAGILFYF